MDLSLNADAALRAYLSPESWNGYAEHRFIFRTEEGEEEPLLARLALVRPFRRRKRYKHCVILRPEGAEVTRISVAQGHWHYGNIWMTAREASRFKWLLFERNLMDDQYSYYLSRFCLKQQGKHDILLRYDALGIGEIDGSKRAEKDFYSQHFDWHPDNELPYFRQYYLYGDVKISLPCDGINLQFLRQSNPSFQQQVDSDWNNPTGEVRSALRWQQLSEAERNAIAFHCQDGDWNSFRSIAALALRVRLGRTDSLPGEVFFSEHHGTYHWIFDYGKGTCGEANLQRDKFLLQWLEALVQVFKPDNINAKGIMDFQRPSCICRHITDSELWGAIIEPFSHHELLEANLQLRDWANAHFPAEEAQRLLVF